MLGVLQCPTKHTPVGPRPVSFLNLIGRRKLTPDSLPEKYLDLRRNSSRPDMLKLDRAPPRDKLGVSRFNRKTPRRGEGPHHGILFLREQGEASSKALPIFNSSGERERRKSRTQPLAESSKIETSVSSQYENRTGKATASVESPTHQSSQNRVDLPFLTTNFTRDRKIGRTLTS